MSERKPGETELTEDEVVEQGRRYDFERAPHRAVVNKARTLPEGWVREWRWRGAQLTVEDWPG